MKGVLLAGGYGSRLRPMTNITNKHLLPVYSVADGAVPMIMYPITTLRRAGITDILIIASRDHCGDMFQTLGDGNDIGVELTYRIQEMNRTPTGIAQALKLSRDFVGDDKFAVILGDNFYEGDFSASAHMFETMSHEQDARIFLKEVHDPERFGVATVVGESTDELIGKVADVSKIVEKPKNPESNYAVTGLYFYTPHVFDLLPNLKASNRGELEITDANNWYVNNGTMTATILSTYWHDMGTPSGIVEVQNFLATDKMRKFIS